MFYRRGDFNLRGQRMNSIPVRGTNVKKKTIYWLQLTGMGVNKIILKNTYLLGGSNVIDCWELNSGGKLVVEKIPYLKSAAVGVYIKVGSRNENASLAGASHFVEHMLFKGTARRTARAIAEGFESMGGQLNAFTSKEYTCVYARTLDEDIYEAMDIVFDMLFDSQLNEKDFRTEREVVIEESIVQDLL
jgi:hypothetical protein